MSEHTPGPWKMTDRRHAALKNIIVETEQGAKIVAEVQDVHQRDYQGSFRGDHKAADAVDAIGLANARLIAAAPDLLAALEGLVEKMDEVALDPNLGDESDRVFPHYEFDDARAAIAKATGNRCP